jgi:hypothetical protein
MSSDETLGRDPAPAAIRYLVLLSAFVSLLTAITFYPKIIGNSTPAEEFYQGAIPGFTFLFILSMIEWFTLRRSRKMFGPYGLAFGVEILKTFLLSIAATMYVQQADGSFSSFLLLQLTSLAILFMLALTKVARTKIEEIAQKDISRNLLNLLPTFIVLALFLGTYVAEIAGLGTPRQRSSFEPYTDKEIDWSMFNTPTWDATYLLENLLDQFTAGLSAPDVPLFNVSSDQSDPQDPIVYWRLASLSSYEYTGKAPYSTDWNPVQSAKRILSPIPVEPNTTYSNIVSPSSRTASFTVRLPLDYNDSIADVTIHPSFINYLPTTWNGRKGSYISSNDFYLYDAANNPIITTIKEAREVYPTNIAEDLRGIDANIRVGETSGDEGTFEYTMDYEAPDIQMIAAFSLLKDNYSDILDPTTWNAIKSMYIYKIPNSTETIPTNYVVHGSPGGEPNPTYADWAPTLTDYADEFDQNTTEQTVFGKAYALMKEFAPDTGNLNLSFDMEMWLGQQIGTMARPAEYEDYNEWFLDTSKEGVSLHFASTYATMLRWMGIPSRVVIGYIGGNDSSSYYPWRVITSRFLHAWAEVLVPIDPLIGSPRVEWVSFDPLLTYFADLYGIDLPEDIIPTSTVDQALTLRPDYDLEGNSIAQLYLDDQDYRSVGDWIIGRCTINHTGFTRFSNLKHGDHVNLSVRVITAPALTTWLPLQNVNVSFYIGIVGENETGSFLDYAFTDSRGVATIDFDIDVLTYGIRTIQFYAVVSFEGEQPSTPKAAISFEYRLIF